MRKNPTELLTKIVTGTAAEQDFHAITKSMVGITELLKTHRDLLKSFGFKLDTGVRWRTYPCLYTPEKERYIFRRNGSGYTVTLPL